jgi:hypothetical protein
MSDIIKEIKKNGMKNRAINESIKEVMELILKNREEKKKKEEDERLKHNKPIVEQSIENIDIQILKIPYQEHPETERTENKL